MCVFCVYVYIHTYAIYTIFLNLKFCSHLDFNAQKNVSVHVLRNESHFLLFFFTRKTSYANLINSSWFCTAISHT